MTHTYKIIPPTSQAPFGIKCLVCGRTSWNQNDVKERYCGNCHQYHDIMGEWDGKGRDLQDSTS